MMKTKIRQLRATMTNQMMTPMKKPLRRKRKISRSHGDGDVATNRATVSK